VSIGGETHPFNPEPASTKRIDRAQAVWFGACQPQSPVLATADEKRAMIRRTAFLVEDSLQIFWP
jgi:hypothetical protein